MSPYRAGGRRTDASRRSIACATRRSTPKRRRARAVPAVKAATAEQAALEVPAVRHTKPEPAAGAALVERPPEVPAVHHTMPARVELAAWVARAERAEPTSGPAPNPTGPMADRAASATLGTPGRLVRASPRLP